MRRFCSIGHCRIGHWSLTNASPFETALHLNHPAGITVSRLQAFLAVHVNDRARVRD